MGSPDGRGGDAAARGEDGVVREAPHSAQNFCCSVTGAPQAGQTSGRADPHSAQNLLPAALSAPQVGQVTVLMVSLW